MKKALVLMLALAMTLSLAACGGSSSTASSSTASSAPAPQASSTSEAAAPSEAAPVDVNWTKNVEIQVPASAGGGTDVVSRTLGTYISQQSGSNLTVINNTDGGGVVAYETVRNAKLDASTLLFFHTTMLIKTATGIYDKSATEDFKVVYAAQTTEKAGYVLLVSADYDAQTLDDVIAKAKANPGQLLMGVEVGGSVHIQSGLFAKAADIDVKFVEAGPDTEKLTALVGGSIDMCLVNSNQAKQYLEAGKVKAIAVVSRDADGGRSSVLPDVPSFVEQGLAVNFGTYFFVLGPKDMDDALAQKIYQYYDEAVNADSVNEILVPAGFAMESLPYDFGVSALRMQQEMLNGVVEELGLQQK